jgi:hypothetical protein
MAVSNTEIFSKLMDVSDAVSRIEPTVNDLKKAVITGNGRAGLLERVNNIEIQHGNEANSKKDKKETRAKWDLRAWAIFMLFIGQVIILIFK